MKQTVLRLLPFGALALMMALRIWDPTIVESARWLTFDFYQRLQPRVYNPQLPVKVVDIDSESLARLGQWPWPRTYLADMVRRLGEMGAAAIAFDMVFAEPDRSSPEQALASWAATPEVEAMRAAIKDLPSNDQVFADEIAGAPVVTGFVLTFDENTRLPEPKSNFAIAGDNPKAFIRDFPGADVNLPVIEAAAVGNGSFNAIPEVDSVIRRVPLVLRSGDQLYPSLAAEALRVAQGASTYVIKASGASGVLSYGAETGIHSIKIGQAEVRTDREGRVMLHYTEFTPDRYVPAWRIFEPDFDFTEVAGKIILIGTSAAGLFDIRSTPLNPFAPGVEVHAQLLEQVFTEDFLVRPEIAVPIELSYMLILGLVLVYLLPRIGAMWSTVLGTLATAVVVSGSWYAFVEHRWLIDPVAPSLMVLVVFLTATLVSYFTSEAERRQVRNAFSHYLSPVMVERLAEHPDQLKLGGELRTMTIMFSDIRGFTSISERYKDDPEGLTTLINRFLTPMTEVVLNQGGTIDKYIGDCLMGFWNAPVDDEQHSSHACRAALQMFTALKKLNRELAAENGVEEADELDDLDEESSTITRRAGANGEDPTPPVSEIQTLRRQAETGAAGAQYKLGKLYRDGIGITADPVEAARWFRAAAVQGYAKAQRHLGTRYAEGEGVEQDRVEAILWLMLAAEQGLATAEMSLEQVLATASPEQRNEAERRARTWQAETSQGQAIRLDIGIGISTGPSLVGNLGSNQRFDYSVLGDAVNLASRLEAQTKNYGVGIVVSEATHEMAPEFAALELDLIAVKGKSEAVRIYGLLGDEDMAGSEAFKTLAERHAQMLAAYRGQSWSEARTLMDDCTRLESSLEKLYDLYRDRIGHYELEPPGQNWDGVYVALTK